MHNIEEYGIVGALNYKNFRPPLHQPILSQCLKNQAFNLALDVGCGVGHSSIGLSHFCKRVIGYDISKYMLKHVIKHEKITYTSTKPNIEYDLLCFFGSLNYINESDIIGFTKNLTMNGKIICCDFKINYNPILKMLKINPSDQKYNYQKNINDYNLNLKIIESKSPLFEFECDTTQLSHLMLTEPYIKKQISKKNVGQKKLSQILLKELNDRLPSKRIKISSKGYCMLYNNRT